MGRPRKPPAFLVEATVRTSAKLAELSSDTARLGFFYAVLSGAKLSEFPGSFASRGQFRELAGRFAGFLEEYVKVGLLEVAPGLCERCAPHWIAMPPRSGALVVHNWHDHQYDPWKVERQRAYEERQRGVSDGVSDAVSDGVSDAKPTPDSRGRGRGRPLNSEQRTTNGSSPHGEIRRSRGSAPKVERADVQALLDRGFRRVTKDQRRVLDEILDRHDETGPEFAAEAIRRAAPDADPLAAVMTADRAWQKARRRDADQAESIWASTKERDRFDAAAVAGGGTAR